MNNTLYSLIAFFVVLSSIEGFSQGTVRGKIIDENGEGLIGATIVLQDDGSIGTATDFEGIYSFTIKDTNPHVLIVSYIGYTSIEQLVQLSNNEIMVLDFVLKAESEALEEVVVTAKQEKSNNYYMEKIKQKSATTLDYMPADLMKKVGDSEVSSAIARVPGVSTNGGFFSVRGISDRYVKTTINGSIIPTLDPFTNNVKLDLFPTSLVDNIIITKTQSPDLPGDWSGAYISVETKDYPEKLAINIQTSVGFNPQTTFKEVSSNQTSSTDWLGYDNNFRDIDHSKYIPVQESPTRYEELVALGQGEFYNALGITENWEGNVSNTYFNLGLVEMGLLGKAYINDPQSISKAQQAYFEGSYQNDAFKIINDKAALGNSAFANNWDVSNEKAPLNFSQNFTLGNQTRLFGKTLGFLVGFRYSNAVRFDPNSTNSRTLTSELTTDGEPAVDVSYNQSFTEYSNGWTALVNANMKLNENNSVSFLFMPNQKGTNSIRVGVDTFASSTHRYAFLESQFYEERSQMVYQYKSKHYLPQTKIKINLFASYTDGESTAPDFKDLNYFSNNLETFFFDKTISNIRRNFRYLDDDVLDAKVFFELPLVKEKNEGAISKFKFGGAYLDQQRAFTMYDYRLSFAQGSPNEFDNTGLDSFFADDKFTFQENANGQSTIPLFYRAAEDPANDVIGHSKIYAGFVMLDQSLSERIRLSGGLRTEYTDIFSDVKAFDALGYGPNDGRRRSPGQAFVLTPVKKKQWDLLPSINALFKIRMSEQTPMNLRLNYSKTIARPSIREYTETIVRDFELNADVFGNAELEIVQIHNMDLRLESYFKSGDNISVSLFYKNFKNHIELLSSNAGFTWANADLSYVYGLELEGKKQLGEYFEFRVNASAVKSFTRIEDRRLEIENGIKTWIVEGIIERTMFGQAPYVLNGILTYSNSTFGLNASISYNLQGEKLVLTSIDASPDIYELPRHLLNFKIGKSIGRHLDVSFSVGNILDAPIRRSYNYDGDFLLDFDRFTYGTDFSISIGYKL